MNRYVVIMAGGKGARLWPLSRAEKPKQFLALTGEESMLQVTWQRALQLVPADHVLVVGDAAHEALYQAQLPDLGPENLLLEPQGRNTAPCLALTAHHLVRRDPEAVMIVLSADHVIVNEDEWVATMRAAAVHAEQADRLVNIGIVPTAPETRFGYMLRGERLAEAHEHSIYDVTSFVEKPDVLTLGRLLKTGDVLRNMGMFAWRADRLLSEIALHLPVLAAAFEGYPVTPRQTVYEAAPSISVDHGVLQHSRRVSVVESTIERMDVGDFSAFADLWPVDEAGNASLGPYIGQDSARNIVYSDALRIATIGVDDLVIIAAGDTVLICPRDRTQDIKELSKQIDQVH